MKKFIYPLLLCFLTLNIAFSQNDNDGDGYDEFSDCNDWDVSINPGQYEDYCNQDGVDNDCNGSIDENYDYYLCNGGGGPYDNDGDGYDEFSDCNDWDASINPGQYEDYCNQDGIDNDCNGSIDENYDYYLCNGGGGPYDNDGDGYDEFSDCNDWDASINPGQYEDYCNQDGIDNDCNGSIDENFDYYLCYGGNYDNDGDGYDEVSDCNDWDASINPGQYEDQCNNDGVDNNCDGQIDENYNYNTCNGIYDNDGDGYDNLSDCDDSNFDIYPGASEICDGVDNDCDGATDEDLTLTVYYIDNDGDGYGAGSAGDFCSDPGIGYTLNNDDCDDDNSELNPGIIEICDSIDNNCNGSIDEGLGTAYYTDNDGDGYGAGNPDDFCSNPGVGYTLNNDDCDDDNPLLNPSATEIVNNGIDEDCDGADLIVGLNEIAKTEVVLYPNPGNNALFIKVSELEKDNLSIRILDNLGKIVLENVKIEQMDMIEINTSEFSKGTYQIVIQSDKQIFSLSWVKT